MNNDVISADYYVLHVQNSQNTADDKYTGLI